MKKLNRPLLLILVSILLPKFACADIVPPLFQMRMLISSLLIDFVINSVIFGIAYLIFFRKDKAIFKISKFLISLIFVTLAGFFADFISIPLVVFWPLYLVMALVLITVLDLLICKNYLKADFRKSLYVGLWMGILTNPIWFFLIVYGILSKFYY